MTKLVVQLYSAKERGPKMTAHHELGREGTVPGPEGERVLLRHVRVEAHLEGGETALYGDLEHDRGDLRSRSQFRFQGVGGDRWIGSRKKKRLGSTSTGNE